MKHLTFLLVLLCLAANAEAKNYHRLPLAYIPYPISSWFDHNPTAGVQRRYDGMNIPNGSYFEDGHRGNDFSIPVGTVLYATVDGYVLSTYTLCPPTGGYKGNTCGASLGNYVAIKSADNMVAISAHMSSVSVSIGQNITCVSGPGGTVIGYSGHSGSSTGPHLHFELRENNLSKYSTSHDPFSTSWYDRYWYDWAWWPDPLNPGSYIQYPITMCQP